MKTHIRQKKKVGRKLDFASKERDRCQSFVSPTFLGAKILHFIINEKGNLFCLKTLGFSNFI